MTDVLFNGVISQYIDASGKTRMLTYRSSDGRPPPGGSSGVCLMISPIPPLNVPEDKNIRSTSLDLAQKFIKEKRLVIKEQDGTPTGGIQGLWVETSEDIPGIYFGYIPITLTRPSLRGVPFSKRNDPLRTDGSSDLESFRRNRKLAEILKQYTLYTYARDPDNFTDEYLWVDTSHNYDIEKLDKRLFHEGNDVMYNEGYLIVPSEDVKKGLLFFLKISLANDQYGVLDIVSSPSIENYYQTISDFRKKPDQLIFTNKSGVLRWKQEAIADSGAGGTTRPGGAGAVSLAPLPKSIDPYYYRNAKIRKDALVLVQNVSGGSLESALSVANEWRKARISTGSVYNIGYNPPTLEDEGVSYVIYTEMGEHSREVKKTQHSLNVLWYEDGTHAALLFFA